MRERKTYAVYIMASRSLNFYIDMSSNLYRLVWQHKHHTFEGFTAKYHIERLLYYETFDDVIKAIAREKQLKGWSRVKKIALIKTINAMWMDLSDEWYRTAEPALSLPKGPSTPSAVRVANDRLRSG
jgi:putative endonuclease